MQIREKGKKVLFIRTEYKPDLKRTVGYTFASQPYFMSTICDEVRPLLTEEEVDQLEVWLSARAKQQTVDMLTSNLKVCSHVLKEATKAFAVDGLTDDLSEEEINGMWEGIVSLQKALRKAGYARPKVASAKKPTDNKTQELELN